MRILDLPVPHDDGSWVSAKASRIVEMIREYAPGKLDVRWIHPSNREPGDAAFCIVELTDDGWRTAFTVKTEEEMDERVLARLYEGDSHKHDVVARHEALQKAHEELKYKEWRESWDEAMDESRFLVNTPLHTVRFKDKKLNL